MWYAGNAAAEGLKGGKWEIVKGGKVYLNVDGKGRVLIPAFWRKELGLRGRIQAEKKKSSLVLRGASEQNFFIKYAGFVGKKYKIKPMTAEEFDETAEKAMLAEARRKFK